MEIEKIDYRWSPSDKWWGASNMADGAHALQQGAVLETACEAHHEDWKTASVRKYLYPPLPKGTRVVLFDIWKNLYGIQYRVQSPSGQLYDLKENELRIYKRNQDIWLK